MYAGSANCVEKNGEYSKLQSSSNTQTQGVKFVLRERGLMKHLHKQPSMYDHHRQTIENLRKRFEPNKNHIAFIVNGSVAREDAGEGSDVDFYLVVEDPAQPDFSVDDLVPLDANEDCIAPCPEANGFVVSKAFLKKIRDEGSEFMRWAFYKAQVIFSREEEIYSWVKEIPIYPEAERTRRMESYHSQIYYHYSFFEFAYYSQTKYLIYETATRMLLAAGRLILADNRRLYPGRKWFYRELERTPDQPDGFCKAMVTFLEAPALETGHRIIDMLEAHKAYPVPSEGMKARLIRESMLNLEEW
jgi:predicted nucleotidyltransferase